jgi:hypothetical protein
MNTRFNELSIITKNMFGIFPLVLLWHILTLLEMQFTRRPGVSSCQFQNSVPRSVSADLSFSELQNIMIEVKLDIPVLWAEFEHKPSEELLILRLLPFKDRLQTRFRYSSAFVYGYLIFLVDSNWSCVSIMFLPALCLRVLRKFSVSLIASMWICSSTNLHTGNVTF